MKNDLNSKTALNETINSICKNTYNNNQNECETKIKAIYDEGYNKGSNEHGLCLSTVTGAITGAISSIPKTIYGERKDFSPQTTMEYMDMAYYSPQKTMEYMVTDKCNIKFDLLNKEDVKKLNTFQQFLYNRYKENYTGKTLEEYLTNLGITINNGVLDFSSKENKLSDIPDEIIEIILDKLSDYQNCDIFKNITEINLYNHNFKEYHYKLLDYIFNKFKTVNIIRFGIITGTQNTTKTYFEKNSFKNFNIVINEDNGTYILAKRIKNGGKKNKRKNTKKNKRKNKKTKRIYK